MKVINKFKTAVWFIAALVVILSILGSPATTYALSQEDKQSIYNDTVWYKGVSPDDCDSQVTVTSTLPDSIPEPYKSLFTRAAAAFATNPNYLAALFLTEHHDEWPNPKGPWASSPVGASGPFQFMPATFDAYKKDGNGDGKADVQSLVDSSYTAANFLASSGIKANSPLGDLEKPFVRGTFTRFAGIYNAGPFNIDRETNGNPNAPLSVIRSFAGGQTYEYIYNAYTVVHSGFTKGYPSWGDGKGNVVNRVGSSPGLSESDDCSSGVVAGNIVQTALNFAWPTTGHCKDRNCAKRSYQIAMPKFNGSVGDDEWSDCGVFVATVMIASGADPDYVKRSTSVQMDYVDSQSQKYQVFKNINSISQLEPGDILVNTQHTYIYVGNDPSRNYNAVGASHYDHVPQSTITQLDLNGEHFWVVRMKK
jgi:hypothetical protein